MASETITFFCSACGIKLTVPASLAGVSGPCPSCRAQIQAPLPAPPPPVQPPQQAPAIRLEPSPAYQAPPPPSYPAVHEPAPVPTAPQVPPQAAPAQAPAPLVEPAPASTPTYLKPEPRQLPTRQAPAEVVAKPMPEASVSRESRRHRSNPLPRHPRQPHPALRLVMPVLFLAAALALIFGVWKVLKSMPDDAGSRPETVAPRSESGPDTPSAGEERLPTTATDATPAPEALPTPSSEQPVLVAPPPELPAELQAVSPAMEALGILESFLSAQSLEERLPLIETKTAPEELAASILAKPLPPVKSLVIDAQESNPLEGVVDFYYNVDFEAADQKSSPQTLLVRTRGTNDPKVVVDPFLDLFGGRLAAYAAQPSDKAGVFQVLAYPVATCLNPDLPNPEKKRTLKLLARDNTKEIALAYFGQQSKIAEMLHDGTYSLSYGKSKSCTVMLSWNTQDDPARPFLEAVKIVALDWNP